MHPRYAKRQDTDITAVPSASGISGLTTAGKPSATRLIVGTSGLDVTVTNVPDFAPGSVSVFIDTGLTVLTVAFYFRTSLFSTSASTTALAPSQTPSENPSTSSAIKSVIPLSVVIGACVGAFFGAIFLICLSVWFYRRSSRRPPRARQQQPLARSHGINPSTSWTRFDDDGDKWQGRNETAEKTGPGSVTLPPRTQRAASQRSTKRPLTGEDPFESQHDATSQSQPFSHHRPNLVEQTASEPPRPVGVDSKSLDGSTTGTFLTLGTVHIESGKMSPTFNVAKTTPLATTSVLHRWESAEVIDPDADAQEVEIHSDLFSEKSTPTTYSPTETIDGRKSFHNPFFSAHPGTPARRPSTTRKSSNMSISSDPFNKDEEMMTMPKPKFISHVAHDSSSSGGSFGNEKSMQGLIAALGLSQEVIEERLRIASMHPSEASRYSTATDNYAMPVPETADKGYVAQ